MEMLPTAELMNDVGIGSGGDDAQPQSFRCLLLKALTFLAWPWPGCLVDPCCTMHTWHLRSGYRPPHIRMPAYSFWWSSSQLLKGPNSEPCTEKHLKLPTLSPVLNTPARYWFMALSSEGEKPVRGWWDIDPCLNGIFAPTQWPNETSERGYNAIVCI